MTSLSTDFTEKLFADYEANAKYGAIENAVTHKYQLWISHTAVHH